MTTVSRDVAAAEGPPAPRPKAGRQMCSAPRPRRFRCCAVATYSYRRYLFHCTPRKRFYTPVLGRLMDPPCAGLGLCDGGRDWRNGRRLAPEGAALDFVLGIEAARSEPVIEDARLEHEAMLTRQLSRIADDPISVKKAAHLALGRRDRRRCQGIEDAR